MLSRARITMVSREAVITIKGKIHFGAAIVGNMDGSIEFNNCYSQLLFELYYTSNKDANKAIAAITHNTHNILLSEIVSAFARGIPGQIITAGELILSKS